ncbi:MAG: regulatory protein RecX [Chloroflexia bacterium]
MLNADVPVVLRMEADPRDGDRVLVTIGPADAGPDAARTIGLHIAVVSEEGLQTGTPCPPELLGRLLAADEFQSHYARALNFLAVRPRSEVEVRDRLRRKAVPPETIEAVMARLRRAGYLDDAEFARYWIGERTRSSPRGPRLLRQELRTKGVSSQIIEAALADFEQQAAEQQAEAAPIDFEQQGTERAVEEESREVREALALAQRKLRSYSGLDPQTFRRRMGGFLLRRGYGYDVVSRVLKQFGTGVDEGED